MNSSIRYVNNTLYSDNTPLHEIAAQVGTPTYVYSLPRMIANLRHLQTAFAELRPQIHYSAKANANLAILRALIGAGAGVDAVSGGEIHRALAAGASPSEIVFAGVGKTPDEIRYAVEQGVGWFNIENRAECDLINDFAEDLGRDPIQVALRFNPEVTANTHPYIATGHGGAKFGLTAETITSILDRSAEYPYLNFSGIHVHIGSQLQDVEATRQAIQAVLSLIAPYPNIRTINIGGGFPVAYTPNTTLPTAEDFAAALRPLLRGYEVILEPGRSIVADAGVLLTRVLYMKYQAGQAWAIVDGSMTELIRPALYKAHHEILPIIRSETTNQRVSIAGPVCETADVLGRDVVLSYVETGSLLAIMTVGAYGMVMSSNYNARPRPAEVVTDEQGWRIVRRRETWDDLISAEQA